MKREDIERKFCWKISSELKMFKYRILKLEKEEIYASAYQIDCIIRIYEMLLEKCKRLESEKLQRCMEISGLLLFIYNEWLKIPDSQEEELNQVVEIIMSEKIMYAA